jgi:hypothetical protein
MQRVPSFDIQSRIQSVPASFQQQGVSAASAHPTFAQTLRTVAISLLVDRALSA